jgi:hypothetical protein
MQEGVFLDWTASTALLAVAIVSVEAIWCRRGDMRNLLGVGVLAADLGDANVAGLTSLGEGVVAAVEIFALLQA